MIILWLTYITSMTLPKGLFAELCLKTDGGEAVEMGESLTVEPFGLGDRAAECRDSVREALLAGEFSPDLEDIGYLAWVIKTDPEILAWHLANDPDLQD